MKKNRILFWSLIATSALMAFDIMDNNGRAGATGSPGESACNKSGCHSGNPLNDPAGSITISAPTLTGWQYTPGQTYSVSVTVARIGVNLFGFAMESLTTAGANAGSFSITNATETTTKSATISGNLRTSVVHKLNGGATADSHTFNFNWTAPATNVGNITFYAAGNAANGNNLTSGDFIYTTSQVLTPAPLGVDEQQLISSMNIFPNPAENEITVCYELKQDVFVSAKLMTLTGQTVQDLFNESQFAGKRTEKIKISPSLSRGVYLVAITAEGNMIHKKIIIK